MSRKCPCEYDSITLDEIPLDEDCIVHGNSCVRCITAQKTRWMGRNAFDEDIRNQLAAKCDIQTRNNRVPKSEPLVPMNPAPMSTLREIAGKLRNTYPESAQMVNLLLDIAELSNTLPVPSTMIQYRNDASRAVQDLITHHDPGRATMVHGKGLEIITYAPLVLNTWEEVPVTQKAQDQIHRVWNLPRVRNACFNIGLEQIMDLFSSLKQQVGYTRGHGVVSTSDSEEPPKKRTRI
jgi:hypothetical protein